MEMEAQITISRSYQVVTYVVISCLLSMSNIQTSLASTTNTTSAYYLSYLKTSCNSTTYPALCYDSLYSSASKIKANDLNLCIAALKVSLKAAKNTSALVTKVSKQKGLSKTEAEAVKDCLEEISDCIDELNQSSKIMGNLSAYSDVPFQIDNVKTWVSAAITDASTCTDGLAEANASTAVKDQIRPRVVNLGQLTSNALALINGFKY